MGLFGRSKAHPVEARQLAEQRKELLQDIAPIVKSAYNGLNGNREGVLEIIRGVKKKVKAPAGDWYDEWVDNYEKNVEDFEKDVKATPFPYDRVVQRVVVLQQKDENLLRQIEEDDEKKKATMRPAA